MNSKTLLEEKHFGNLKSLNSLLIFNSNYPFPTFSFFFPSFFAISASNAIIPVIPLGSV